MNTTTLPRTSFFALVATLALSACGGPSLEGDWFFCGDPECNGLEDFGLRFEEDSYLFLDVQDSPSPYAGYCYDPASRGGYSDADDRLVLFGLDIEPQRIELGDDTLTLTGAQGGRTYLHRMRDRKVPACGPTKNAPQPQPEPQPMNEPSCFERQCSAEINACSAGCASLLSCLETCASDTCAERCVRESNDRAISELQALFECSDRCS